LGAAPAAVAQTASSASRMYPEIHNREIGYHTSLHLNQWVMALTYRTNVGLPSTDFGGYFSFMEREGTGSLMGLGVDVRHLLTAGRVAGAPAGMDMAAVAGLHIAGKEIFSGDTDQAAVTVPLGLTLGRWVNENGRVFVHPRIEFSSQRNICDDLREERCVTRWIPKLEAGAQVRINPSLVFGASLLTGDARISRPGFAMGATWVW
ncbi:MAG TPA: hypothetical protein VGR27_00740, partial [Longimicrobiaceae bacterium]|nr:hypothetical protein [Longimicrobiaceae bacterium]